jgi:fatty acid desaturase
VRPQIEHHLFPAMAYTLYPQVVPIVKQECARAGVPYTAYDHVPAMMLAFVRFMKRVGAAP